jgi:hypothetical protein
MTDNYRKTARIVGTSRTSGLALAAAGTVIGTVRGGLRTGLHDLADSSEGRLVVESLDMTEPEQISALRERLATRSLDLLFVNAAGCCAPWGQQEPGTYHWVLGAGREPAVRTAGSRPGTARRSSRRPRRWHRSWSLSRYSGGFVKSLKHIIGSVAAVAVMGIASSLLAAPAAQAAAPSPALVITSPILLDVSPNGPITGTASSAEAGQDVNISLGNNSYSATVQADGKWSVTIPPGALPVGLDTVTATLTDDAGDSTTVTDTFVQI